LENRKYSVGDKAGEYGGRGDKGFVTFFGVKN
jgi:hypothetical protein